MTYTVTSGTLNSSIPYHTTYGLNLESLGEGDEHPPTLVAPLVEYSKLLPLPLLQ